MIKKKKHPYDFLRSYVVVLFYNRISVNNFMSLLINRFFSIFDLSSITTYMYFKNVKKNKNKFKFTRIRTITCKNNSLMKRFYELYLWKVCLGKIFIFKIFKSLAKLFQSYHYNPWNIGVTSQLLKSFKLWNLNK